MRTNVVLAILAIGSVPAVIATLPFFGLMPISTSSPPWDSTAWAIPWGVSLALSFTLTPALLYIAISDRLAHPWGGVLAWAEFLLFSGGLLAFQLGLWYGGIFTPVALAAVAYCLGGALVWRRSIAPAASGTLPFVAATK